MNVKFCTTINTFFYPEMLVFSSGRYLIFFINFNFKNFSMGMKSSIKVKVVRFEKNVNRFDKPFKNSSRNTTLLEHFFEIHGILHS